ncbi:MAG TPA: DUF1080 domain-containing protein [Verrucomicrobiae bacterium]
MASICALFCLPLVSAGQTRPPSNFVSLFDGKTLGDWIQDPTNFTILSRSDFTDLPSLAQKLINKSDPVSTFLSEHLDGSARAALTNYVSGNSGTNRFDTELARSFTQIISGPSIYDAQRFHDVLLRPEIRELLSDDPHGPALMRLNRLLLEDAYPADLAKSPATAWTVKDDAIASTGAGRGTLYTAGDYSRYRILFTMRHRSGKPDHQACVLIFCTRPPGSGKGLDALGGIQFQVPNAGHWDYRPGHNDGGKGEFKDLSHPKFDPHQWSRVELLVDAAKGTARMAVAQPPGSNAVEVLDFNVLEAGKTGPFALQMHNAGLFDEYKDIEIETNPTSDDLTTIK